ncbi:MBL fold metallo-hydrolase RNA specificity domain-containing protein [Daejeonella lutea]|uniref:Metallo-beta-lactamase family protein n=1 Tax=Daejeonella lutea TaxID=572036 RepID=A0A1T5AHX5_9SPHI|nr:MBL fold metallo-hydrolase [Daejeonella lutea]SKB34591.1 metallo-beta-lactamase family protein [Daejeonella lutea]
MKLTVWGAAQQVTGSMHLLETVNYNILIDCGLDYEKDTWLEENEQFPFLPSEIDVVILTHAHIDHSGNLPTLVRHGFDGQILCTPPTADLTELLLLDSVNIFLNKQRKARKSKRGFNSGPKPLYLQKHVMETVDRFVTIGFNKPFAITGNISLSFVPVGHLLGAAAAVFTVNENGSIKTVAFSGDLGRKNYPVLNDPEALPQVDYLVCESTYGGRWHKATKSVEELLTETVNEACIKSPGRLIIPAFSVGRTQALVYSLNRIFTKGLLPRVKVFVDSPMATYATDIFRKHHPLLNQEAQDFYKKQGDEFEFENLEYIQDMNASKAISNYYEPCIIISSAGMLEGGRIQDHLYYNISNYYCTILFIGYCAKGTLGNRLLRGDPIVNIRHRELSVYATIKQTDLFSGHGDHNDLMNFVKHQQPSSLKKVFLVHGEISSMESFRQSLHEEGYSAEIAVKGETYLLD